MNKIFRTGWLMGAALVVSAASPAVSSAQTAPAALEPTAAARPATITGPGLRQALASPDRLLSALAERELTPLLEYGFAKFNIPEAQQPMYKFYSALRKITDPRTSAKLTQKQRKELVADLTAGIDKLLSTLSDPRQLMQLGATMTVDGTQRDVNTLEYWGDNPKIQAQLRPIAESIAKLYDRAAEAARNEAERQMKLLTGPNDARIPRVEEIEGMATLAMYNRSFNDYTLALSLDAASPDRAKYADRALEILKDYDNPEMQVQVPVRNRMAKLYMVKGDYPAAKEMFAKVLQMKEADTSSRFEAMYFSAICDLLAKKPAEATQSLQPLKELLAGLPAEQKETAKGISAAIQMLEYRIAASQKKNAEAMQILLNLVKERPDLEGTIYDILITLVPKDADMGKLDPLLLRALVAHGEEEARKAAEEQDKEVLDDAIKAANEIITRKNIGLPAEQLDASAYLLGWFQLAKGADLAAATSFLDYVEKFHGNPAWRDRSFENAGTLITNLVRKKPEPPTDINNQEARKAYEEELAAYLEARKVYHRFLPIAVNAPFNRLEFAFDYAMVLLRGTNEEIVATYPGIKEERRIALLKQIDQALAILAKTPASDPRTMQARFSEIQAWNQKLQLGPKDPNAPERIAVVDKIQQMAESFDALCDQAIAKATDPKVKEQLRVNHVFVALTAADLAWREKPSARNSPERTIKLLANFEEDVKDLPGTNLLVGRALYARFNALMKVKDTAAAIDTLTKFITSQKPDDVLATVQGLLESLDLEYNQAQREKNRERMVELAGHRATVSRLLLDTVLKSQNPEIKKFEGDYREMHARTMLTAASLEEDAQKRTAYLTDALTVYQTQLEIKRKEAVAANLKPAEAEAKLLPYILQIALIQFDLGSYSACQPVLADLVRRKLIGKPQILQNRDDNQVMVDNPQYWEVLYKLMRSTVELANKQEAGLTKAQADNMKEETAKKLRELYVLMEHPGSGTAYGELIDKLRVELLPNWQPPKVDSTIPTPTTQP